MAILYCEILTLQYVFNLCASLSLDGNTFFIIVKMVPTMLLFVYNHDSIAHNTVCKYNSVNNTYLMIASIMSTCMSICFLTVNPFIANHV